MVFAATYTDIGGRKVNEDRLEILKEGERVCAVVADGLGGHGCGDMASSKVIEVLKQTFDATKTDEISGITINEWIHRMNYEICRLQTQECQMKTTIALLFIEGKQCMWAHVGDTRIYHFLDGKILEVTNDHSLLQMKVQLGEIKQEEVRIHQDQNKLLRALGSDDLMVDISPFQDISQGEHVFLLCSDGFWEYVLENEMEETLQAVQNPVEWLKVMRERLESRVNGKHDNNTAVAVWINQE